MDPSTTAARKQEGQRIGRHFGNYRVVRELGAGGMGAVYEAVHEQIGERAAIKVLHAQYSRDPEFAKRFFNEARAVNLVQHNGLVNIYEYGQSPEGGGLHRHGLSGRGDAGRADQAGRRQAGHGGTQSHPPDRLGAGGGARQGHHPPRPQARQRHHRGRARGARRRAGEDPRLWAVSGTGPDDIWIAGSAGKALRWNGTAFDSLGATHQKFLHGVRAAGPEDVWVVGEEGKIDHWDGTAFSPVGSPTTACLAGMWGGGPKDIWACGGGGAIAHWDGMTWSAVPSNTSHSLLNMSGSAADNVRAVGSSGTVVRWNGTGWTAAASLGAQSTLHGVWVRSKNDVWVVGVRQVPGMENEGVAYQWDGTQWRSRPTGVNKILYGARGSAADDIWVVGHGGTILRWDGTSFTPVASGNAAFSLINIWGSGPGNIWAVGYGGVVLHYQRQ